MKIRAAPFTLPLAAAFALCAQARGPDVADLKAYSLPTYTLVTHEERAARQIVPQLALMERLLSTLLKREVHATGTPTYVYAVSSDLWLNYLRPSNGIDSEFVPGRFANYLILGVGNDSGWMLERVSHEYTHYFLRTQAGGNYPLWFDEGMAKLVQKTQFRRGVALIGEQPIYFAPGLIPMERLLRIDKSSPEYLLPSESGAVHSQSWAMVHMGFVDEPAFGAQILAYLKARDDFLPIDEAVAKSFGMTAGQLGQKVKMYMSKPAFGKAKIPFDSPAPIPLGAGRELSELEGLESIATFMLDSGFNAPRLAEVIEAAGTRAPDSDGVKILKMRLFARDRSDAELNELVRGINPGVADPALARGTGLALFERVRVERNDDPASIAQRRAWSTQAFGLLDQSLAARPDDAEAAWAFGMLAARLERSLYLATRRLDHARERVPINADLAMAQALVCQLNGERGQMIVHLTETARFSRFAEQQDWALARLANERAAAPKAPPN